MTLFVLALTFGIYPALCSLHLPQLAVDAAWEALLLLGVCLFAATDGLGVRSLNPGKKWNRWDGLLMAAIVLMNLVASMTYAYALRPFLPTSSPWLQTVVREFKALDPLSFGVVAVGLALLIGLSEELAFRSYFMTRLRDCELSARSSILLTAAAFGLLHWPDDGLLLAISKGIFWGIPAGYFFYRRGSILPLIAAHSFVDALAFTLIYFAPLPPHVH